MASKHSLASRTSSTAKLDFQLDDSSAFWRCVSSGRFINATATFRRVLVKAKIEPAKWFLALRDDVRSSDVLEDAATEFDVQGLELDWTCVCWDANFRRAANAWQVLQFKGTRWQTVNDEARKAYVANAYRVLLTRGRQGMVAFVPEGSDQDGTRDPGVYDAIYANLVECGFDPL